MNKKFEIAKYLLFRKADIKLQGEVKKINFELTIYSVIYWYIFKYGDALVTAIHCDAPINLVKLLLEKGADLASRHTHWVSFILMTFLKLNSSLTIFSC